MNHRNTAALCYEATLRARRVTTALGWCRECAASPCECHLYCPGCDTPWASCGCEVECNGCGREVTKRTAVDVSGGLGERFVCADCHHVCRVEDEEASR